MELQYDCYVKGWNLYIKDRILFNEEIKTLDESKEYVITIKSKQKSRSNKQNRYYFGVVLPLIVRGLRNAGFEVYSKEGAHDIVKVMFLKTEIENDSGEFITAFKSTKDMNTKDFKEFIDNLQYWASEYLNEYIPSPNESQDIEFI
jgi:hypothetical protein